MSLLLTPVSLIFYVMYIGYLYYFYFHFFSYIFIIFLCIFYTAIQCKKVVSLSELSCLNQFIIIIIIKKEVTFMNEVQSIEIKDLNLDKICEADMLSVPLILITWCFLSKSSLLF